MEARTLQRSLTDFFASRSGHDPGRDYLGMSQIAEPEDKLLTALEGERWKPSREDHLKLRLGHLHEAEVKAALEHMTYAPQGDLEAKEMSYDATEREVVADFDERFRGHTDGHVLLQPGGERVLVEIKSIGGKRSEGWPLDDIVYSEAPPRHAIPSKHYCQVQCYMRHGGYDRCWMIYVDRSRGLIWTCELRPDASTQDSLDAKARRVLERFDAGKAYRQPPKSA